MATDAGSKAPMSTTDTVSTTSKPSRTGKSDPTRYVNGLAAKRSHTTSTIVAVAMPPIRFPAASPRWPDSAAEMVTANSGRLPATASSTIPPSASPIPSRLSISSVDFASSTPAPQVAPEAATNTRSTRKTGRDPTSVSSRTRRGEARLRAPGVLLADSFAIAGLGPSSDGRRSWVARSRKRQTGVCGPVSRRGSCPNSAAPIRSEPIDENQSPTRDEGQSGKHTT